MALANGSAGMRPRVRCAPARTATAIDRLIDTHMSRLATQAGAFRPDVPLRKAENAGATGGRGQIRPSGEAARSSHDFEPFELSRRDFEAAPGPGSQPGKAGPATMNKKSIAPLRGSCIPPEA